MIKYLSQHGDKKKKRFRVSTGNLADSNPVECNRNVEVKKSTVFYWPLLAQNVL